MHWFSRVYQTVDRFGRVGTPLPSAAVACLTSAMPVEALRTPDDCFMELPGFPYSPCYLEDLPGYLGLRMAFIDAGPRDGAVVLCLHGEPTWSYLYRKMIPVFAAAGLRVIVPDLFGFGRSDKPVEDAVYTFDFHRNSILNFIEKLKLRDITLVVQDWGGILGLTIPVSMPHVISRLLIMNTALGVGSPPGEAFMAWRRYVEESPDLDLEGLYRRVAPSLSPDEVTAYAAPWPAREYKAGVRMFPRLVPITPNDPGAGISREAAAWWANTWDGPSFMAIGISDPVLGPPVMGRIRRIIRGCPEPMLLDEGHFVPESGEAVARAALRSWGQYEEGLATVS